MDMVERNHHMLLVAVKDKVAFQYDNIRFPSKSVKYASNQEKNTQNHQTILIHQQIQKPQQHQYTPHNSPEKHFAPNTLK